MDETVHDDLLFGMLKECRTLPIFMDHVFGFLRRRTDFYIVTEDSKSPVGLPPGVANSLVYQTLKKYAESGNTSKTSRARETSFQQVHSKSVKKPCSSNNWRNPSKSYNGASFDNYCWSQTYNDVDLFVKLPENTTSRDIKLFSTASTVTIKLTNGKVLLEGELCQKCKSKPVWSIESNELLLHLEKMKEIWWDCFLIGEPKIDINRIECIKPLEDLPEDAQAKIHELQWNQEQKRLGLPTSDQMNSMSVLKRAWNATGSPFTGPFDPTAVSFN